MTREPMLSKKNREHEKKETEYAGQANDWAVNIFGLRF
jgi:hypothetical protein